MTDCAFKSAWKLSVNEALKLIFSVRGAAFIVAQLTQELNVCEFAAVRRAAERNKFK